MSAENLSPSAEHEFVITRTFDAPRDRVWAAFTESERLMHWWGPKGFTMRVAKLDLRPGGAFHYGLTSPDGRGMWGKFVYRDIVAPERLVFVVSFSDEEGGVTRHPMSPTWPLEILNTATFNEQDGKTTLTLRGGPINAPEADQETFDQGRESVKKGFGGTLDQLAEYLSTA